RTAHNPNPQERRDLSPFLGFENGDCRHGWTWTEGIRTRRRRNGDFACARLKLDAAAPRFLSGGAEGRSKQLTVELFAYRTQSNREESRMKTRSLRLAC